MNITSETPSTTPARTPKQSMKTAARSTQASTGRRWPAYLSYLLALSLFGAGIGVGALIMRQRYKAKQVVFAVNGTAITEDTFHRRLEQLGGLNVIRQIANEEMTLQFARKIGVLPSQAKVEEAYAEAQKRPDFNKIVAEEGLSEQDVKHKLLLGLTNSAMMGQNITASEAEVKQYYQENIRKDNPRAQFYTPPTVQLAVIVTKTREKATQAEAELQHTSFGKVAKKYSQDSSRNNGGVLRPIRKGQTMAGKVPGLEAAAFGLKIGQTSSPRQYAGVWWIMRCLDKTSEELVPFDKVRKACETGAISRKGAAANGSKLRDDLTEFRKSAKIQTFWPQYKAALSNW